MTRWILFAVLAVFPFGGTVGGEKASEAPKPDMMDILGRYQLQLPVGWGPSGTNSKLNGYVVSDSESSFVAVYEDGDFTVDDVPGVLSRMCGCSIPETAEIELLEDSVYPAEIIVYSTGEEILILGGTVFPDGMFGLVSILDKREAIGSLKYALANARPGPARTR